MINHTITVRNRRIKVNTPRLIQGCDGSDAIILDLDDECHLPKLMFSAENPGEYYQRYKVCANLCNAFKVEYSDYIVYGKEDPVIFNSIG